MLFVRIKGFCAASLMAFVPIKDFLSIDGFWSHRSKKGRRWKSMLFEEKRARAQCLADKAKRLGFRQVGFLIRDAYGQSIFSKKRSTSCSSSPRENDLVSVDVLLSLGRAKALVQEL